MNYLEAKGALTEWTQFDLQNLNAEGSLEVKGDLIGITPSVLIEVGGTLEEGGDLLELSHLKRPDTFVVRNLTPDADGAAKIITCAQPLCQNLPRGYELNGPLGLWANAQAFMIGRTATPDLMLQGRAEDEHLLIAKNHRVNGVTISDLGTRHGTRMYVANEKRISIAEQRVARAGRAILTGVSR